MNCTDVDTIVDSWETRGDIAATDLQAIRAHIERCPVCATSYVALIPVMHRDAGNIDALTSTTPLGEPDITTRIMDRVKSAAPAKRRPRAGIVAAAAVFIATIGFLTFWMLYLVPTMVVEFTLDAPHAQSVHLTGDFNKWDPTAIELSDPNDDGIWSAKVRLKRGAMHSYNFVIDGELWVTDPESIFDVDDGFGGRNSIVNL